VLIVGGRKVINSGEQKINGIEGTCYKALQGEKPVSQQKLQLYTSLTLVLHQRGDGGA
jgi:hypothetical protein